MRAHTLKKQEQVCGEKKKEKQNVLMPNSSSYSWKNATVIVIKAHS